MKNHGYIYKTINLINNKIYIGQHIGRFDPRYFGGGIHIKRAVNKYGKEKFKLEIIIYAKDKQELNELEKQYIKEYRERFGRDSIYNISDGGEGHQIQEETKQQISLTLSDRKLSDEHRQKISLGMKGRKLSDKTKEKIRNSLKGISLSEERKKRIQEGTLKGLEKIIPRAGSNHPMFGKHHSLEARNKISEARRKYLIAKGCKLKS